MEYDYISEEGKLVALIDGDIVLHRVMYGLGPKEGHDEEDYDVDEDYEIWLTNYNNLIQDVYESTFADEYHVFISGPTNFREKIYPEYKQSTTRKAAREKRGELYRRAKRYVTTQKRTYVSRDREADDSIASSWFACPHRVIIASNDKDLRQCSGSHYDIRTRTISTVTKDEAKKNFCRQMLWGDSIDNIPGVPGIGEVKSLRILDNAKKSYIAAVIDTYKSKYGKEWETQYDLMGNLLWLQRQKGQRFCTDLINDDQWF